MNLAATRPYTIRQLDIMPYKSRNELLRLWWSGFVICWWCWWTLFIHAVVCQLNAEETTSNCTQLFKHLRCQCPTALTHLSDQPQLTIIGLYHIMIISPSQHGFRADGYHPFVTWCFRCISHCVSLLTCISINQSINHCFNEIWQNAYYDKVCTNKSP